MEGRKARRRRFVPHRIEFLQDPRWVRIIGSGEIDGATAEELARRAVTVSRENETDRYLCDFRQAVLVDSAADVYDLPMHAARVGLKRTDRIAIVHSKQEEVFRFVETVAMNRGYEVRVFHSEDRASGWLRAG
ncbi:MAG: hypothetical protein GF346_01730 [Candidatus Eisenbacteria bacterium]|nr:hypothetical protein [Candidatus Latescibacterota bacterium]MBD3301151.1 hypothetical protein [Candidatus Eisenbacteria bacterium]